jgi:transcriptional regulator with XRE-family HTH domain
MTFRELRERKGFKTGSELARTARVQQTTVSQLDYGKVTDPRYSTVEALAEALGTTPAVVMRAVRETAGVA